MKGLDEINEENKKADVDKIATGEIKLRKKIKLACELYATYRVMPHALEGNEPQIFNEWIKFAKKNKLCPYFANEKFQSYEFQCWLFEYCFSDLW